MKRFSLSLAVSTVLSCYLVGCATFEYKPAEGNGPGYRSQKISENKYVVTLKATEKTPKETVESFLLYRAAELTKAHGYDYFLVKDKDRDVVKEIGPIKTPVTQGNAPIGAFYFPYFATGFPWTERAPASAPVESQFEATAMISMHKGPVPQGKPISAFKAVEVLEKLKSKVD